jgi:hypothetical protein
MHIMNMFPFCLSINGFMFQCFHEPLITCIAMTHVTQFILQKKTTSKTKKATHYKVHIKDTSSIRWNNAIVLFNLHNVEECNSRLTLSAIGLQCMQKLCNFKPKIGFFDPTINMWFLSQYFFPPKDWVKIGSLDLHLWFPIPKMDP